MKGLCNQALYSHALNSNSLDSNLGPPDSKPEAPAAQPDRHFENKRQQSTMILTVNQFSFLG